MKKLTGLFFTGLFLLFLCGASCSTLPEGASPGDAAGISLEHYVTGGVTGAPGISGGDESPGEAPHNGEDIPGDDIPKADKSPDFFFHMAQNLAGGLEVVAVYPQPNAERCYELLGQRETGQRYFEFQTALRPKPISGADQWVDTIAHQGLIARQQLAPDYTLQVAMEIHRNGEALDQQTLVLHIRRGVTIQDYRREGGLKYTVKKPDGYYYGEFIFASAQVIPDENPSLDALEAYLDKPDKAAIPGLLAGLLGNF
jgi:hypothetical protein